MSLALQENLQQQLLESIEIKIQILKPHFLNT
jgi:hypothetical protein